MDLASELIEPDVDFIAKMLNDLNADVRVAIAHRLELGLPGAAQALGLIGNRLRIEPHVEARAALLRAQATLSENRPSNR
ncbi:MAG: hypothetical protein KF795_00675 [Labilithrix sp.]|nr:hypothetical protein [Labilithrix sp.]